MNRTSDRAQTRLLALALAVIGMPAWADIYRCTDSAGAVRYQSERCPDASAARTVEVPASARPKPSRATTPSPASAAAPPLPRPRNDPSGWGVIATLDGDLDAPPGPSGPGRASSPADSPGVVEAPFTRLSFTLATVEGGRQRWTNSGPESGRPQDGVLQDTSLAERGSRPLVFGENGTEAFTLVSNGSALGWLPKGVGGPVQDLTPPSRLAALSWARGLALDPRTGTLAITSKGWFHRYDTRKRVWLDAREMKRSPISLAFDERSGGFVGLNEEAELITTDDQGTVRKVRPLGDRLPGLRATYRGIGHAHGITLAASGGVVALVNIRKGRVTHIWTYDSGTDRAQLTYRASA